MAESRQDETTTPPGSEGAASGVEVVDVPAGPEARIAELEARLRTVSAAFKEKQDEIQNVRDRLHRQALLQEEIRRGEVVTTLFEPVANLHRSLDAVKEHQAEAGLRMVYQQFMDALRKLGLEEVPGVGTKFDPSLHEAIATRPVATEAEENVIVEVFSTGYRIGSRLVRPARVVIGSYVEGLGEA